jgi:hypothetical protein
VEKTKRETIQVNVQVNTDLYEKYKSCVEKTGNKVVEFNGLVFSRAITEQIEAYAEIKDKPKMTLFTDLRKSKVK